MAIWWPSSMEDANNNWDLHAVVRGCSGRTTAAPDPFRSFKEDLMEDLLDAEEEEDAGSSFSVDSARTENVLHELEELCKPFACKPDQNQLGQESAIEESHKPQLQEVPAAARRVSHGPRSKRRKNQQKKVVCQIPADGLSSDLWAWRKYGQKPIKGSPYPRGYYRCSSSKGCLARKQVERSRTDPTKLIVTYTAEHNHPVPTHRNSLAGSTRTKFPPLPSREGKHDMASNSQTSSSPSSMLTMTGLSPTTPLIALMEDDLLMPKGDVEEENDEEEEDEEDLVKRFFSNVWQDEGSSATTGAGDR